MAHSNFCRITLIGIIAMVSPALGQQAPDAAKTTDAPKTTPAAQNQPGNDAAGKNTNASEDAEAAATAAAIAKANAAAAAAGGKSAASRPLDDAAMTKKAKEFGWHAETRQGTTVYCREMAVIGSRFTEKKCATEGQLAVVLEQQEFERDQLKQRGCGGNCGSK
jgi:hypothetical protein